MDRIVELDVNGFQTKLTIPEEDIEQIIRPLLEKIKSASTIFLAGLPGTGKSTFGKVLEVFARKEGISLQCVGMDGFHFSNAELKEKGLASIKGAPETFDINKLKSALNDRKVWPLYSRILHEPSGQEDITEDILIIEGNYFLLKEEGWNDLNCDLSIWLEEEEDVLIKRLIERKMRGGMSEADAKAWVMRSDKANMDRVLSNSRQADIIVHCPDWA